MRALPGVRSAGVFFLAETLDVQFSPAALGADALLRAVRDAGFSARLLSTTGVGARAGRRLADCCRQRRGRVPALLLHPAA